MDDECEKYDAKVYGCVCPILPLPQPGFSAPFSHCLLLLFYWFLKTIKVAIKKQNHIPFHNPDVVHIKSLWVFFQIFFCGYIHTHTFMSIILHHQSPFSVAFLSFFPSFLLSSILILHSVLMAYSHDYVSVKNSTFVDIRATTQSCMLYNSRECYPFRFLIITSPWSSSRVIHYGISHSSIRTFIGFTLQNTLVYLYSIPRW